MSDFNVALPVVLKHEGGFNNDPNDPGGATKYGVSLYWLKSVGEVEESGYLFGDINHDGRVDLQDIMALTPETAGRFYQEKWWDFYGFGQLVNQSVGTKMLDTSVNMGGIPAIKLLQKACANFGYQLGIDGKIGPQTIAAANSCDPTLLLPLYRLYQKDQYRVIATSKPRLTKYLQGWYNRADDC